MRGNAEVILTTKPLKLILNLTKLNLNSSGARTMREEKVMVSQASTYCVGVNTIPKCLGWHKYTQVTSRVHKLAWTGSLLRTEARRQQVAHKMRRGAQVAALLFVMIQNTSVVRRSKSEHWSHFDNDTKEKWTFPLLSLVANTARIQFGDLGISLWVRPPSLAEVPGHGVRLWQV